MSVTNENNIKFQPYVVMAHYARQGWNPVEECETFEEAVIHRERWLGKGINKVTIFKPVEIAYLEK